MNTQTESNICVLDAEEPEEKTIFTFDELDDRAKDRVRYSDWLTGYDWWDWCEEDSIARAKLAGLRVGKTYFNLSYSQGDYAFFDGSFYVQGKAAETLLSVHNLERWALLKAEAALEHGVVLTLAVNAEIKESSVGNWGMDCLPYTPDAMGESFERFAWEAMPYEPIRELVCDLSRGYYNALRDEYEYQTSDEAISEVCEANGWLFDEDGNLL